MFAFASPDLARAFAYGTELHCAGASRWNVGASLCNAVVSSTLPARRFALLRFGSPLLDIAKDGFAFAAQYIELLRLYTVIHSTALPVRRGTEP